MYKYLLESENINWLATASLVIFFVFFVAVSIYAFTKNKSEVEHMRQLPLEEE